MLAPADAAVVARDRALPGLSLVLDPDAMAERIGRSRPGRVPVTAQATYVRYKPGTSCLVGYRLVGLERSPDDVPELIFAKSYRSGDGAKLAKAKKKADGDVVTFGPELVVVAGVTDDRDLPGARRLHDDPRRPDAAHLLDARRRLLRRLLPSSPELWSATPRVLRYKPERRWVGTLERQGTPVALVKAYRKPRLARAAAGLRFAAQTSCASPPLLGTAPKAGALASSWVQGHALSDVLQSLDGPGISLADVGAAVAELHRADPAGLVPVRPGTEIRAVVAAASLITSVLPTSGPSAAGLATELSRRLVEQPSSVGARHGDLSPDQVVCGRGGVTLVDFDDVGAGEVAVDLGHFLATLVVAELEGSLAPGAASGLAKEFLAGYAEAGASPRAEVVATHTSAALVRLAVEPFRLRQPGWPTRTDDLLEAARTWSSPDVVPC